MKHFYKHLVCIAISIVAGTGLSPLYAQYITTIAGTGVAGSTGDGSLAIAATVIQPNAAVMDGLGNVYIADFAASRVRKINTAGVISTFVGNGTASTTGDGGPASAATVNQPYGIAIDALGNIYISEYSGGVVRRVNTSGTISTWATGLTNPAGLSLDGAGNLYIADWGAGKVIMVSSGGTPSVFAGTGTLGYSGDGGPATAANLGHVSGVAADGSGNVYIAVQDGDRVRKVNSSGDISTVAGTGTPGFSGDGGLATAALLHKPTSCAVDAAGNLYIADETNLRLRKVTYPAGTIETISGTGIATFNGDAILASTANISPNFVSVAATGELYLTDGARVRRICIGGLPTVDPITGSNIVCQGGNTTLADVTPLGTWSSSNTTIATVSAFGVVSGVATGTTTISYTVTNSCGSVSATMEMTVNTVPIAGTILGPDAVCAESNITLASSVTGGSWSSVNTAVGTISATGILSGLSAGTTNISYTVTNTCGTTAATKIITVNVTPAPISGLDNLCVSSTTTLGTTPAGGTWSSPSAHVNVVGGTVSGLSPGTAVISYTLPTGCLRTTTVTVNAPIGSMSGSLTICAGAMTFLSHTTTGGTWASGNLAVATAGTNTGIVTGVSAGTADITYTAGGCTTSSVVTVSTGTLADPGTLSGATPVCAGSTNTIVSTIGGGSWSTSDAAIATVNTSGVVTGVAGGTATISYTVSNSCGAVSALTTVTFNAPSAITGALTVCEGATTGLSSATLGGTWSSATPGIADVGATTGVVTGIAAGTAVISYFEGGCYTTAILTVNPLADPGSVTGPNTVCTGATITLTDATPGGSWSSSAILVATVGTDGVVSGIAAGTATISYTVSNSCGPMAATMDVTVNTLPDAGSISGAASVCVGASTPMTNAVAGGTWSSSSTAIATVGTNGLVLGVATGTVDISYTTANGCGTSTTSNTITVNPLPAPIAGATTVCRTFTVTLTDATAGGTWSVAGPNASIDATTGVATGMSAGTAIVSYALPTGCGVAAIITVNPSPTAITGGSSVCEGLTLTLTDTTSGGTWSSSSAAATVSGILGVVTGASAGTATISYTLSNGCYATKEVTVYLSPGPIAGPSSVCRLSTITLSNSVPGGTWQSSSPGVLIVGSASGVVTGMTVGTAFVVYKMPGNCTTMTPVTVLSAPAGITGVPYVCEGSTTTLANPTYGGIWISSNTAVAEVVTPAGIIGGISAGTTTITYVMPNGCYKTSTFTVNPTPSSITGPTELCSGQSGTYTGVPSGGVWTASVPSSLVIGFTSGIATGATAGESVVTYRFASTGCKRTYTMTVNASPSLITGTGTVCEGGSTTLLSSTPLTGTWSSSNTAVATVPTAAGLVNGVAAGTAVISYILPPSGCYKTAVVTVNPLPTAITGPGAVCDGDTIALASTTPGGSWTSSATGTATVGASSGTVTGVAAGTTNITYSLSTGCKRTTVVTVNTLPYPGLLSGSHAFCEGTSVTLTATVGGGTWSSTTGATSIGTSGVVTGTGGGLDTIVYTVTDVCGASTVLHPVTVNALPVVGAITGADELCVGQDITLATTPHGGTWSNGATGAATVSATGVVTGVAAGTATISYTRTNGCGSSSSTRDITVNALAVAGSVSGIDSFCIGDTATLTATVPGGEWISKHFWIANAVGADGKVAALYPGSADIWYIVSNSCSADTATHTIVVRTQLECETAVHDYAGHEETALSLFPNPSLGAVTIEAGVPGILTIATVDGRTVDSYSIGKNATTITLSKSLSNGIYICRFVANDGSRKTTTLSLQR
ncbi:MAG: Ig-like domain-containing protein [Taibaiella sp.]|nr:Ig-like domain-containing protein [Taibaiella sp.]